MPHWPKYDQKEGYLQIGATIQQAQRLKDKEVAFWTELLAKKPPLTGHTELWMEGSVNLKRPGEPKWAYSIILGNHGLLGRLGIVQWE